MRDDAFRVFLAPKLSAKAVASYLANLRATERALQIDLDTTSLGEEAIVAICRTLRNGHMPPARASDCGSALRKYATFKTGKLLPTQTVEGARVVPRIEGRPRADFIADANVSELMQLYADILAELRSRGVTRTANGPVGDYAEALFAHAFDWKLAGNASRGFDAETADGVQRIQIKARRLLSPRTARQLSAIRQIEQHAFHILAGVLFDQDMVVLRAALIPYDVVKAHARRVELTNSWRLMLSDRMWTVRGVQDVTDLLRAAADTL